MTGSEAVAALPAKIKVGPFDMTIVKLAPTLASERQVFGEFSCLTQEIRIKADIVTSMKAADTFVHELLHAIWWAYGIYDDDKEERTVSATATGLVAAHRDNGWLAAWLAEALEAAP